ncbi:MAG: hypothetical protein LBF56_00240 [Holosporales bacterium]|nr:hypothetical protein [Holosporales bacterium]
MFTRFVQGGLCAAVVCGAATMNVKATSALRDPVIVSGNDNAFSTINLQNGTITYKYNNKKTEWSRDNLWKGVKQLTDAPWTFEYNVCHQAARITNMTLRTLGSITANGITDATTEDDFKGEIKKFLELVGKRGGYDEPADKQYWLFHIDGDGDCFFDNPAYTRERLISLYFLARYISMGRVCGEDGYFENGPYAAPDTTQYGAGMDSLMHSLKILADGTTGLSGFPATFTEISILNNGHTVLYSYASGKLRGITVDAARKEWSSTSLWKGLKDLANAHGYNFTHAARLAARGLANETVTLLDALGPSFNTFQGPSECKLMSFHRAYSALMQSIGKQNGYHETNGDESGTYFLFDPDAFGRQFADPDFAGPYVKDRLMSLFLLMSYIGGNAYVAPDGDGAAYASAVAACIDKHIHEGKAGTSLVGF